MKVGRSERARLPPQRVLQLLLRVEVKRADQEVAQPDHLRARSSTSHQRAARASLRSIRPTAPKHRSDSLEP